MIWLQTSVLIIWSHSVLQLIEIAVQTDFIRAFDFFQNGHGNKFVVYMPGFFGEPHSA